MVKFGHNPGAVVGQYKVLVKHGGDRVAAQCWVVVDFNLHSLYLCQQTTPNLKIYIENCYDTNI